MDRMVIGSQSSITALMAQQKRYEDAEKAAEDVFEQVMDMMESRIEAEVDQNAAWMQADPARAVAALVEQFAPFNLAIASALATYVRECATYRLMERQATPSRAPGL